MHLALCGGLAKSCRILAGEAGVLLTVAFVYALDHAQAAGVGVQRLEQHHRHATRRSCTLNADLNQATYNALMADPTYNVRRN